MYEPDFLEARYQVPPLSQLLECLEVEGVARFIELPCYGPEAIHTLVYTATFVSVSSVVGATSLWDSIPQFGYLNGSKELSEIPGGYTPFDPGKASHREGRLERPFTQVPTIFTSW